MEPRLDGERFDQRITLHRRMFILVTGEIDDAIVSRINQARREPGLVVEQDRYE